ncbi:MAG: hypothetical protein RML36_13275 [Anaerolineae bacterium]|nr:hypothetical protein [Anaerolineae bacterium]MDW8100445.1 hypothetical protein [Anaerolineae bacterium]
MGGCGPDWLIALVGQGTLLLRAWRGLQALVKADLLEQPSRLVAVQAERCAPQR